MFINGDDVIHVFAEWLKILFSSKILLSVKASKVPQTQVNITLTKEGIPIIRKQIQILWLTVEIGAPVRRFTCYLESHLRIAMPDGRILSER